MASPPGIITITVKITWLIYGNIYFLSLSNRSDVNNFSFTLFRKGKRPFGFDEHVRDHKDLKREAIEDVDFIENYGEDQYNKFESEIRSEKELKAFKEI